MNISQAVETLRAEKLGSEDVDYLIGFIEKAERGIIR
jgi:hypothetical protein